MENWLFYLKECWQTHRKQIKVYAFASWCVILGVIMRDWFIAWSGFGILVIYYSYRRWGVEWAERGKAIQESRKEKK